MNNNVLHLGYLVLVLGLLSSPVSAYTVDHHLEVWLQPATRTIQVEDRISLPKALADAPPRTFTLASDARIESGSGAVALSDHTKAHGRRYRLNELSQDGVLVLRYTLPMTAAEAAGDVFLSVSRNWIPMFDDELFSFSMQANAPADWTVISQGRRGAVERTASGSRVRWTERQPQDDVYLIAGRFTAYQREADGVLAMAFLRDDDPELADRYLDATIRYIGLYSELIGPYPYAKFALVENTWDSGYGMPSFTLLGPRVIRLPFIIHTSYPHEVLHNWWGNSVYVDFDTGNWSEGLTAYLADHYLREQRGQGARYRRDALQKYLNYVSAERDFPLAEFRAKHGESSEAVGYNKTLMFFHMLRKQLGDEKFFAGLRRFYADHRFNRAGFDDIRMALERASGAPLRAQFEQWVRRTGAPALVLADVRRLETAAGYSVEGALHQTQAGAPFALRVPVQVTLDDGRTVAQTLIMEGARQRFNIPVTARPIRVSIDPGFDIFRQLAPGEVPPTLSEVFGAGELVFVTPAGQSPAAAQQYRQLMDGVTYAGRVRHQTDTEPLPDDTAIWLLGRDNARLEVLQEALAGQALSITDASIELAGQTLAAAGATVTLAARTATGQPILWTHLQSSEDAAKLARRLRHYGRYSYLAFAGGRPILREQWPVLDSPLSVELAP